MMRTVRAKGIQRAAAAAPTGQPITLGVADQLKPELRGHCDGSGGCCLAGAHVLGHRERRIPGGRAQPPGGRGCGTCREHGDALCRNCCRLVGSDPLDSPDDRQGGGPRRGACGSFSCSSLNSDSATSSFGSRGRNCSRTTISFAGACGFWFWSPSPSLRTWWRGCGGSVAATRAAARSDLRAVRGQTVSSSEWGVVAGPPRRQTTSSRAEMAPPNPSGGSPRAGSPRAPHVRRPTLTSRRTTWARGVRCLARGRRVC